MTSVKQKKKLKIRVISSSPLPISLLGMRPEEPDPLIKVFFFFSFSFCSLFFKKQKTKSVFSLLVSSCNQMWKMSLGKWSLVEQKKVFLICCFFLLFLKFPLFKGIFAGRIVVETNSMVDPVLYIPYSGRVMHGSLKFSVANTTFFTPGSSLVKKQKIYSLFGPYPKQDLAGFAQRAGEVAQQSGHLQITQLQELTNCFRVPITLYSAFVDDPRFSVLNFEPGITIQPNATYAVKEKHDLRFVLISVKRVFLFNIAVLLIQPFLV